MNWPFVSRSRYEDLKAEHRELKEVHERLLDEVNFRNCGFHLYPRFEAKPIIEQPSQPATKKAEPVANDEPVNARQALQQIEAKTMNEFEEKRKTLQQIAASQFESTLREADEKAQGAD